MRGVRPVRASLGAAVGESDRVDPFKESTVVIAGEDGPLTSALPLQAYHRPRAMASVVTHA
eukprot:scaffold200497_cov31-Tisochrysis_lutea.AAC.4